MTQEKNINMNRGSVTSFTIATIIVMLLYVMPQAVLFIRNDLLAIIVTLYYIFFVRKYVSPGIIIGSLLIAVPYLFFYGINGYSGDLKHGFVLPFMTLVTLVMPCFAVIAVVKRNNSVEQKVIIIATAISLGYVAINTLIALASNPLVMRDLTGTTDESFYIVSRMKGIGSYGIAYSMGALCIAFWGIRKYIKNSFIPPVVYYLLIIVAVLLVIESQFGTLLFITIGGIAVHYFIEAKSFGQRVLILVAAITVLILSKTLISLGMTMLSGEVLRYKFELIYESIWGGGGAENISGERSQVQLRAYQLFLQSPIYGYSGFASLDAYGSAHSTILSVMVASGIIGLISYLGMFYSVIKRTVTICFISDKEKRLYYPVVLFYLSFAFLNPIDFSFECSWIIFFVIPLLIYMVFNKVK